MIQRSVKVSEFLEPSAVALLVQAASKFKSRISLVIDEKTANAKSIMGIISLNMQEGQELNIIAEGEDAAEAVPAMESFFLSEKM
ncbi:MAG: HPr family phosphocarrier protein [Defluviitaleaceae bacterium]|nr:HPr family phosphocarrier protein [Defluviitaleaceae bacterium]